MISVSTLAIAFLAYIAINFAFGIYAKDSEEAAKYANMGLGAFFCLLSTLALSWIYQ